MQGMHSVQKNTECAHKMIRTQGELKCTTNYQYLTEEKCDRLRELQHQNRLSQKQLSRLKLKIEQMTSSRGVNLDDETCDVLLQIMKEEAGPGRGRGGEAF